MKKILLFLFLFPLTFFCNQPVSAQGYLHASGKFIHNGAGEEVILRGIGTGNWLLQEGYMMKTEGFAGTQHEFRQKLIETIGLENTDTFYESWLNNHFTRTDVDSMKSWGFNSIRVAMHYKWFTLPIEEEPVSGQDTWFEEGFARIDSLLDWCADNQMYLILDLHAAPGGQGKDSNISDYDPTKPSLWESAENRRKTVALWGRLAARYVNEPWMGGYDLINEPNWELPGGTLLKQLYQQITTAIRAVDQNHMIIIEGNWFANDYTGLTPPWDNNMVYSFHKYWTYNTQSSIDWMISIRNTHNVPIWLGESGENSNSWFTDLIALCEANRIGWSWWPVKKDGINNVLKVTAGENYDNLIRYWKTGSPAFTAEQAFDAVLEFSENHRIENCTVQRDVIDAMIRQPSSNETLPFRIYHPGEPVHAVNYDLGRCSRAYWDADTANYRLNTNVFVNWNEGWAYRNDGVDIQECNDTDPGSIGYNIGWTNPGEWLQYTIQSDTAAAYTLQLRSASGGSLGSIVRLQVNGTDIISPVSLPVTGGWQTWNNTTVNKVILPAGTNKLRLRFERSGSNFNFLSFTNPQPLSSAPFNYNYSETSTTGKQIFLTLNKAATISGSPLSDFSVSVAGVGAVIEAVETDPGNPQKLILTLQTPVRYQQVVKLSYTGNSVQAGEQFLDAFSSKDVKNNLPVRYTIPVLIQAENFSANHGFELETCTDAGGGKNTGFANPGDYLDYFIYVAEAGEYTLNLRYATESTTGRMDVRTNSGAGFSSLGSVSFASTGGWQTWRNHQKTITLPAGEQTLRFYTLGGEFNLNWFEISKPNAVEDQASKASFKVFPNPGNGLYKITAELESSHPAELSVLDTGGNPMAVFSFSSSPKLAEQIDLRHLRKGIYIFNLKSGDVITGTKVILQ